MRPSDESRSEPARQTRKSKVDLRLSLVDGEPALPWRLASPVRDELGLADVVGAARAVASEPGAFLVGGGDPLRRRDLRELLDELSRLRANSLGISTFGHGVTTALIERLSAAGVDRLHVPFHCARQDAHDYLVGQSGALKAAHRAIRASIEVGIPVAADVVLTRPTMAHLAETIEVLGRLGVRTVNVRRLTAYDTDDPVFVPLSPRLSLLEESLENAAEVALTRGMRLTLRELPLCAAPRLRPLFAAPDAELWITSDGRALKRGEAGSGCTTCPGSPQCAGAPRDYVARFGWEEFIDRVAAEPRIHENVEEQKAPPVSAPMTFAWRGPRRVRCEACADQSPEAPSAQRPYESTRVIRSRLVQAARYRPSALRLVGADLLAHPQAALLAYDAVRLFRHVEIAGEASAVVDWSDLDLRRLKDLKRIDVALYGPDAAAHDAHCGIPGAFAAVLRGVERLRQAKIPVGAYAIVHDVRWIPAFADAWSRGALPGEPRFRLSARGSSLDELLECARALPAGKVQAALAAVLPSCLWEGDGLASGNGVEPANAAAHAPQQRVHDGRSMAYAPCGSDPIGAFELCQEGADACKTPGCPGTAVGWQRRARSQRWSGTSI